MLPLFRRKQKYATWESFTYLDIETSLVYLPMTSQCIALNIKINKLKQSQPTQMICTLKQCILLWVQKFEIHLTVKQTRVIHLDNLSSLWRKLHLNFKRQAKQTYYICTVPIRIVGYESAEKSAIQATFKSLSNCVKIHILCCIHIFYSKETFFLPWIL